MRFSMLGNVENVLIMATSGEWLVAYNWLHVSVSSTLTCFVQPTTGVEGLAKTA